MQVEQVQVWQMVVEHLLAQVEPLSGGLLTTAVATVLRQAPAEVATATLVRLFT